MSETNYKGEQWRKQTHTLAEEFERNGYDKSACSLYRSIIADARAEADALWAKAEALSQQTPREFSKAFSARILAEHRAGKSCSELATEFGYTRATIWNRAQNAIDAEDEAA